MSWKASVEARSAIHLECGGRFMPAPLPKEVRDRFARRIVEELPVETPPGACRYPLRRAGDGGGIFRALAMQDPDITLFDLRDALDAVEGVTARRSTIAGLLKRLGFCTTTEITLNPD